MPSSSLQVLPRITPLEQLLLAEPRGDLLTWAFEQYERTKDPDLREALFGLIVRQAGGRPEVLPELVQLYSETITDPTSTNGLTALAIRGLVRCGGEAAKRALMFAFWKLLRGIRKAHCHVAKSKRALHRDQRRHYRIVLGQLLSAFVELDMDGMLAKAEFFGYGQQTARPLPVVLHELGIWQLQRRQGRKAGEECEQVAQQVERKMLRSLYDDVCTLLSSGLAGRQTDERCKAKRMRRLHHLQERKTLFASIVSELEARGGVDELSHIALTAVDTHHGIVAMRTLMRLDAAQGISFLQRAMTRAERASYCDAGVNLLVRAGVASVPALRHLATKAVKATARMTAVRGLGQLPLSESDRLVLQNIALLESSARVRVAALEALGECPDAGSASTAAAIIASGRATMRERRASRAVLIACGPGVTEGLLESLANARSKKVQRDAVKALAKIGEAFAPEIAAGVAHLHEPVLAVWNKVPETVVSRSVEQLAPEFANYAATALQVRAHESNSTLEGAATRLVSALLWNRAEGDQWGNAVEPTVQRVLMQLRLLQPAQRASCVLGLLAAALARIFEIPGDADWAYSA